VPRTGFDPRAHGFHFANDFVDRSAPAGAVREPYLGLDDWGAGEHADRSRQVPPGPERPGPDAGDGPWTIEFAVEVTPLEA
jgi:hypothetical protein